MNRPHNWRIRSKLLLLIIFSALLSVILFLGLWHQQNNVCTLLERAGLVEWFDSEAFTEKARRLASDYTVPPFHESDEGMDDPAVIAFQPYCEALAMNSPASMFMAWTTVSIAPAVLPTSSHARGSTPSGHWNSKCSAKRSTKFP